MADRLRERFAVERQPNWSGGVQDFRPLDELEVNESATLQNAEVYTTGSLIRRFGIRKHEDHVTGIAGQGEPKQIGRFAQNGKRPELVTVTQTSDTAHQIVIDDGSSLITLAPPHEFGDRTRIVQVQNRVYFLEPGQVPQYWQHGNTTLKQEVGQGDAIMPHAGDVVQFRGRAWAANVLGDEDLVFFSASNAAGTAVNSLAPEEEDSGERATAAFAWSRFQAFRVRGRALRVIPYQNQHLTVFTDQSVEQIIPNVCNILTSTRLDISNSVGLGAIHSPQYMGKDLYFMDQFGQVRSIAITQSAEARGIEDAPVSLKVRGVFNRVDTSLFDLVRSFSYRGIYGITVPVAKGNIELWLYSVRDGSWSGPIKFANDVVPKGFVVHRYPGAQDHLYMLAQTGTTARVYEMFRGATDDGSTIPLVWESRSWTGNDPRVRKQWHTAKMNVRRLGPSGAISLGLEMRTDEGVYRALESKSIPIAPNHPVLGTSEAVLPFRLGIDRRVELQFPLTATTTDTEEEGALSYGAQFRLRSTADTRFEVLSFDVASTGNNLEHDNAP